MRSAKPAFIALAALALLATPVLAKSTKAQKADTEAEDTPPPCFSYQLALMATGRSAPVMSSARTHPRSIVRRPKITTSKRISTAASSARAAPWLLPPTR